MDEYRYGTVDRISPEAPVPVFLQSHTETKLGMAMNVKANLEAFGIEVHVQTNRPSQIIKTRYVDTTSGYQLMRADLEKDIEPVTEYGLKPDLEEYNAIVISDYDKGFVDPAYIIRLRAETDVPIVVDSKRTDLSPYDDCIIKVNEKEYNNLDRKKIPPTCRLLITQGKMGAYDMQDLRQYSAPQVEMYDVTGAGDVFTAALTYGLLSEKFGPTEPQMAYGNPFSCIQKAVDIASLSVTHHGAYTVTGEDINEIYN